MNLKVGIRVCSIKVFVEYLEPPETGRGKNSPWENSEGISFWKHFDFKLLVSKTMRILISFVWGTSALGMEKEMATHSSTLAWRIPWTKEPGRLQSMGSRRVRHDWATSLSLFTFMHWRRKWQPTLVFLPGESQGWGSLVGCRLWGRTESDMTEAT